MKKVFTILFSFSLLTATFATTNVITPPKLDAATVMIPLSATKSISLLDLSRISAKDFEAVSGRHLNFFQKVGFKLAQKKLRGSINEDGTVNTKNLDKLLHPRMDSKSKSYLRLCLIFLILAIGFSILSVFVPYIWILASLSGLVSAIFFILWLLALSNTM